MLSQNDETAGVGAPAVLEKTEKTSLSLSDNPAPGERQGPAPDLLGAALAYAEARLPVFPCRRHDEPEGEYLRRKAEAAPGKAATRRRAKAPHIKSPATIASTDPATINGWWSCWPDAMIGLVTGERSGLWALDVDLPKQEGGQDGRDTLAALEAEHGALPETVEQRTGSGGRHLLFRWPSDGREVQNECKFAPGLDARGKGGYIIVAPSGHPSGGQYEWVRLPGEVEIADAPEWLLARVVKRPEPGKAPRDDKGLEREHESLLTDEEVLTKARAAKVSLEQAFTGGGKAKFATLYDDGDFSRYGNPSDADLALCCILAFWTGKDVEQMNRLFQASALMRDKWDDVHYANGDTYGEGTLKKALAVTTEVYAGQKVQPVKRILRKGYDLAELLDMEFAPVQWVVPGLVASGLSVLSGAPKLGKSWTVLDIALAKASGAQALGHSTPEAGRVLYLALEDVPRRLKKRIETMTALGKIDATSARRIRFENDWERMDDGGLERLEQYAKDHPDLSLVIIDTWSLFKSIKRSNNNAYEEDYVKVAPLKRFADKVPVILVHHNRKMKTDDIFESMSGSQGLPGAADTLLVMTKKRASTVARLHVVGRDVEDAEIALEWNSTTCRWSAAAQVEEVKLTPERQSIVDLLANTGEPLTPKEIAERLNMKNNSVSFLLGKLVDEAFIIKTGYGRYIAQSAQTTQSAQSTQSAQTTQSSG